MLESDVSTGGRQDPAAGAELPVGSETILFVDDEPLILKIRVLELSRLGYHVIPAESGEQAVRVLREQPVDLLILDLSLPGMDGLESFRRIRRIQPDLKTLVCTGYDRPETTTAIEELGAGPLLLKPTPLPALATAIRSRLDAPDR